MVDVLRHDLLIIGGGAAGPRAAPAATGGRAGRPEQGGVEVLAGEAPAELLQLEHWGCPWSREPDGSVAVRPFGGMQKERTWFAADKTGFHLLHTLFQTSLQFSSIRRYDEWFATRLVVENGRCQGVVAVELRTGHIRLIAAGAVILATGGGGGRLRPPPPPGGRAG